MGDVQEMVQQKIDAADEAEVQAESQRVRAQATEWMLMWYGEKSDLPAGIQGNVTECVFAHALGGSWNGSTWQPGDNSSDSIKAVSAKMGIPAINLPPVVSDFIRRFDRGEYPDLVQFQQGDGSCPSDGGADAA
jgi:hypothetical protein